MKDPAVKTLGIQRQDNLYGLYWHVRQFTHVQFNLADKVSFLHLIPG